jgi:hypothetical protein
MDRLQVQVGLHTLKLNERVFRRRPSAYGERTDARNAIDAINNTTLVAVTVTLIVAVCVGFLKDRAYGQGRVIEWPLSRICYPVSRSESLTYPTMIL